MADEVTHAGGLTRADAPSAADERRAPSPPAADEAPLSILLIEDDPGFAALTSRHLERAVPRCEVFVAESMNQALRRLSSESTPPDLIITDLGLPDSDGLDTVRSVLASAPATPVLVLTGNPDDRNGSAAVALGAQDYLNKDEVDTKSLRRALRYAIERHRLIQTIAIQASRDELTGLANRRQFNKALRRILTTTARPDQSVAFLFIDIDRFKMINDRHGHATGDAILAHVADVLTECSRLGDLVARLAGDEFAIVAAVSSEEDAVSIARRVIDELSKPFAANRAELVVSVSIGVSLAALGVNDAEALMAAADSAMYEAKQAGGNAFRLAPNPTSSGVR